MTAWVDNLNLVEPAKVAPVVNALASLASTADATLDAAKVALDAAKVFLGGTASPMAALGQALLDDAQTLSDDLFSVGYHQIIAHPWVPGLGRHEGAWRSLSFPQAVQAIIRSFDDLGDPERPQYGIIPVEMIVLAAGAPSPSIFKSTLDALGALLDMDQLRLVARRIQQGFDLEGERLQTPLAPTPPDWQTVTVREILPALKPLEDLVNEALAHGKAYADGAKSGVGIASSLVDAKKAQLATLQANLATASALFGQGIQDAGVKTFRTQGEGGVSYLQNELLNATNAPGPELSFTFAVAWVAPQGGLDPLAELLGI